MCALLVAGWMMVLPAHAGESNAVSKEEPGELRDDDDAWLREPLRDPFWPVGFYPPDWDRRKLGDEEKPMDAEGWEAASALIRISGTSRMNDRIAAIINGEIKTAGDTIEITYGGKTYRWEVVNIDAAGRVQLRIKDVK